MCIRDRNWSSILINPHTGRHMELATSAFILIITFSSIFLVCIHVLIAITLLANLKHRTGNITPNPGVPRLAQYIGAESRTTPHIKNVTGDI
eukprot:TRINITY_DN30990_c0_g1_i1.p1 TRINITY_DN30990_c0_g1~~TRINITY_DN30990_c0_g1_i1.p1  ORF type:complete len:101 (+),score=13.82 TRINITY_DN30990_c0_g1_i1:30-305(+)